MKRTGEILRKAREERELSLNEIALSLKINSKVLSALENGDLSKLPAKTFLRGFVQSYSNYLKLNTDEVLALFNEEMGLSRAPAPEGAAVANETSSEEQPGATAPNVVVPAPRADGAPASDNKSSALESGLSSMEDGSRTKVLILSVFCVALVLLIFGTKKIIDRYQRESVPPEQVSVTAPLPAEPAKPEPPLLTETKTSAPVMTPGTAPATAAAPSTPTPVPVPQTAAQAPTPVAAPAPVVAPAVKPPVPTPVAPAAPVAATPVLVPAPVPVKPPPPAPTVPAAAVAKPAESPKPPAEQKPATPETAKPAEKKPVARNLELIIEALDQVDIEYAGATGASQKMRLNADQVHTIRSQNGLRITVSNGGAVNVILNGKDLGVPGELGKPTTLRY
ncbi:MAG: helix-turn-helix domain-containing protein [Bdellovibrionaceae bacterium]|nr:helix-turn-helix domain-containing protein [Pseudobdellovibrionaceae bacterium]